MGRRRVRRRPKSRPRPVDSALTLPYLSRSYVPSRGILYSLLLHEIAFFGILFLSYSVRLRRMKEAEAEAPPPMEIAQPDEIIWLPTLGGGDEGSGGSGGSEGPIKGPPRAASIGAKGASFPGPQPIVSDFENPTNSIQTVLQPALEHPAILQPPLGLPNIVKMADAGPPPVPELVAPVPVKPPEPEPPVPTPPPPPPPPPKPVVPSAPAEPVRPVPSLELSKPALPELIKMEPEVVKALPPPPKPKAPEPPKPPEPKPEVKPPDPPPKPPEPAPKPPEPKPEVKPKPPEPPKEPTKLAQKGNEPAAETSPVPSRGPDQHTVLALSPTPAAPDASVKIPAGEARARFAISPEPNNLGSAETKPGGKIETAPTGIGSPATSPTGTAAGSGGAKDTGGTGTGAGGASGPGMRPGAPPGPGAGSAPSGPPGGNAAGTGTGTGTGSGAGPGSARSPFGGITIGGGGNATGTGTGPGRSPAVRINLGPTRSAPRSYGITIISTSNSGGGLPDFGVFSNEQVYTVYLDMSGAGRPAHSWTMEYSVQGTGGHTEQGIVLPFPTSKEHPTLPADLVHQHAEKLVIVYGVINVAGRLEQLAVKDSPDPRLNDAVLASVAKWVFRPAELDGSPARTKMLLGVAVCADSQARSQPAADR